MSVSTDAKTQKIRGFVKFLWPLALLVVIIGDVFGVPNPGRGDTPSEVWRDWTTRAWSLCWFWGAVTAHLNIHTGQPENYQDRFYTLAAVGVLVIFMNIFTVYAWDYYSTPEVRAGALVLGFLFGMGLWAQNPY